MSLTSPLQPADFADLDDTPPAELAPLLQCAAAEAVAGTLKRVTALLFDRALRLLREGSREQILDEAFAVSGGISGETGRTLREKNPETFGAWAALYELLAEAGRRSDRAAVPSLLRSTQGHGLAILELLAAEGRAVPRAEVRRRLNLGEAHMSHLLRDLERADLIVRYRAEKSKEVLVELGPVGREVVSESILPPWLERFAKALSELAEGSSINAESLANELHETGAPSRLAAETLARPLERLAPAGAAKPVLPTERSNVLPFVKALANAGKDDGYRLQEVIDLQGGQSPRSMFKTSATRR